MKGRLKTLANKYYDISNIDSKNCQYSIVFGERSNGKTYQGLYKILERYLKYKETGAYIRRYREDFIGKRGQQLFTGLVANGVVEKLSKGKWNNIYYNSSRWWLCKWDEELNKRILDNDPFCYAFSLASAEHDKSTSYPTITTIIFDEFLTRNMYLTDEFILFMNTLSTIIRDRNNVRIYMFGNTINKESIYWKEMGISGIDKMKKGDIQIYQYGESGLKVAIEYSDSPNKKGKKSDIYFAFDNPKLKMITSGEWEIAIYPHLPNKYKPKEVVFLYFIVWNDIILQCEVINQKNRLFTFIHKKTSDIKDLEKDLVFNPFETNPQINLLKNIMIPTYPVIAKLYKFFEDSKVFYQDNEIGEVVRNYLMWCMSNQVIGS